MATQDELLDGVEGSFDDPFDDTTADFGSDVGNQEEEVNDVAANAAGDDQKAEEGSPDATEGEVESPQDSDAESEQEEAPVKEPMIPKSRFDSIRRRLKAAEDKLAAEDKEKAEQPAAEPPKPVDHDAIIKDLSKKFAQASIDGDVDQMAELNAQMLQAQSDRFMSVVQESKTQSISESRDSIVTDQLVDELVGAHEELNPDSDKFDQALVTRLNEMRDFYEEKGYTESQALVKTVDILMPHAFQERPKATPKPTLDKKVEAANNQPPKTGKVGEDGPTYGRGQVLDFSKMGLDDLEKVSDAEWDEALGNHL